MKIKVVERIPIDSQGPSAAAWNKILEAKNLYSFFQTPDWSTLLTDLLPHAKPYHHLFRFSDGLEALFPCLALPKKWGLYKLESLPWGTYGDLIGVSPLTDEHRHAAIKSLLTLRRPVCILTANPAESAEAGINKIDWKTKFCNTYILRLQAGFDALWSQRFQPRLRTSIRKAQREGVTVRFGLDAQSVDIMKRLYRNACEEWSGVETLPESFFDRLRFLKQDAVQIWTVMKEDIPVAANVMFYGKGEAQYFAGAADKRYSTLQGPKLLMSEIIRDACVKGLLYFNFGASGGLPGVEQFKGLFGAEETPYRQLHATHPAFQRLL